MYRTVTNLVSQDFKKHLKRYLPFLAKKHIPSKENQEVAFFDRPIIKDGRMLFSFTPKAGVDSFYISVPPDFSCHNDLIAATIVSIFRRQFKKVNLDFEISQQCTAALENLSGTEISTRGTIDAWEVGSTPYLAFSGGFDSLAGYLLCPGYYKLASVDFGERFERERAFFATHDTTIIETNLRRAGVKSFHWLFMGAPLILHADYLDTSSISFGTIFEATAANLKPADYQHQPSRDLRCAVGLNDCTITRGLTEFSTARIVQKLAPDLAQASLKSLAHEGTEKLYRKELLLCMQLIRDGLATNEVMNTISLPNRKVKIGTSFSLDFLYYAFASTGAHEMVARVVDNPQALVEFRNTGIDMSWVNAYNPSFINQIPHQIVDGTIRKLHEIGIPMFTQSDYESYSKFRDYWLSKREGT